jgi:heptosyltransferase-2/heptosyltransferase-3
VLRSAGLRYPRRAVAASPRNVLLIRPDHLGDLLLLTPALGALRRALPDARITLLVGPWSADVVRGASYVDDVLTCPFPGFERRPKESLLAPYRLLADEAARLRPGGFDTAVVLRFDHWWGAWLAAQAGIPRRVGYDLPETRPFLTEALAYAPDRHETLQNLRLLRAVAPGVEPDLGPASYPVAEADRAWADIWLAEQRKQPGAPLVAVHPGAGAAVKQWPAERWAAVARRLIQACGAEVVVTGGPGERALADAFNSALGLPALDAAGKTTLGQLAALLGRCDLVLGSDSGPLHLAVAVGAPTVHLYGPVDAARFGPWGRPEHHAVLCTGWPCAPCNRLDWAPEEIAAHACMAEIAEEPVWQAALRILSDKGES